MVVGIGSKKINVVRTEFVLENRGIQLNRWKARFLKEKFKHFQMAESPIFLMQYCH